MVPSVPVTPEPAVTGPGTTGQKVRQEPSHLDVVGVSMANQYRTMPLESVSTCWPPTVVCDTVLPPAAAEAGAAALLLVPAAGVLVALLELPELPQADTVSARAARPAAPHIVRISGVSPSRCTCAPVRDHVRMGVSVQFSSKSQAARPRVSLLVLRRGLILGWCWCRHRLADLHIDRYVRIRKWVQRGIDLR